MNKSKIGYSIDGTPTYYAWNPFGMGCSNGCHGCWAESLSRRMAKSGCDDCRNFRVHWHPERLADAGKLAKPSLLLSNFTSDWLDLLRHGEQIGRLLAAMHDAYWHTYITLTQNARDASATSQPENEYRGLTIRNQAEADAKLKDFMRTTGKLWVSNEPSQGRIVWPLCEPKESPDEETPFGWEACICGRGWWPGIGHRHKPCIRRLSGIIVGHDNRRDAPGTETTYHILDTVTQCHAAGVPVFVKQLWSGKRLLRASHPAEYAEYPDWARANVLPWQAEADA